MLLYSTNKKSPEISFEKAIFQGLPTDNGLYMPKTIPRVSDNFFTKLPKLHLNEIAFEISKILIGDDIPEQILKNLVEDAINFPAPVIQIDENVFVEELFHGPSLAFKDFGARFMSRIMGYFLKKNNDFVHILVATSGDTGGAVAMGFYKVPNTKVSILYPSGKVSELQEKQLTTLGENIDAYEVKGTFDDCQSLVKKAFLDSELANRLHLTSANSINIARLIPQTFYYFNAYAELKKQQVNIPIVFSVPSGNFGNLTAGLIAKRMGLPIHDFIAATNINDVIPRFLQTGIFEPRPSQKTISNAMDVGNPSNFARINELYESSVEKLRKDMKGYSFDDISTQNAIIEAMNKGYLMCPHTAVGYLGLKTYKNQINSNIAGVILATAHPAKFINELPPSVAEKILIPPSLDKLKEKPKNAIQIEPNYEIFKETLLSKN
jgi:threonine synthase